MKKYISGVVTGCIIGLILATTTFAFGADPIKLMVNGKDISFPEAPPTIINGRTMVPARPLAEALGAKVEWDAANKTVVVTGGVYADGSPTDLPAAGEPGASNPIPEVGQEGSSGDWISLNDLADKYGVSVSVGEKVTLQKGDKKIEFDRPNAAKNQIVIVNVTPTLKMKIDNARFYLSITELQKEGLIP